MYIQLLWIKKYVIFFTVKPLGWSVHKIRKNGGCVQNVGTPPDGGVQIVQKGLQPVERALETTDYAASISTGLWLGHQYSFADF